jgi:AraC-like DNA-binding protein
VLTQWPGVYAKYGPDPGKSWDELYIVYSKDMLLLLQANHYADLSKPVWQIGRESVIVQQLLPELLDAMRRVNQPGVIDEIDRLCDNMILQSLLGESGGRLDETQRTIHAIREYIGGHYQDNIDFNALAAKHSLSQPTFRRHWAKMFGVPPAQYAMNLRMQNACRLLIETRMPIVSISQKLGYDDPLYFSRRFHKIMGASPSEYRRQNHLRSLLDE